MKFPCFLNSRGKKLYRRLKKKSKFEEKRSKKLHLRANIANIVSGIFAALISAGALYHAYNVSEKQAIFQRNTQERDSIQQEKNEEQFQKTIDLMNSYIEINDSLRNLTSQLLEQNRKNYSIQLKRFKSNIETIVPDFTLDSTATHKNYIYPLIEFTVINSGIFPAQNAQMKIIIISPNKGTFIKGSPELTPNFTNKFAQTPYIVAKIPTDDEIILIKVHFEWYDLGLEKKLTYSAYYSFSFLNENHKFHQADSSEISRINKLLKSNLKELKLTGAEKILINQIYPEKVIWKQVPISVD